MRQERAGKLLLLYTLMKSTQEVKVPQSLARDLGYSKGYKLHAGRSHWPWPEQRR